MNNNDIRRQRDKIRVLLNYCDPFLIFFSAIDQIKTELRDDREMLLNFKDIIRNSEFYNVCETTRHLLTKCISLSVENENFEMLIGLAARNMHNLYLVFGVNLHRDKRKFRNSFRDLPPRFCQIITFGGRLDAEFVRNNPPRNMDPTELNIGRDEINRPLEDETLEEFLPIYFGHLVHLMVGTRESRWSRVTRRFDNIPRSLDDHIQQLADRRP